MMCFIAQSEAISKPKFIQTSLDKDTIIYKFKEMKEELKKKFCLSKLYLYGSYAKENITVSSDLDLLVIFEKEMIPIEKGFIVDKLRKYLEKIFQVKIDILDFSHALKNLDINEMENIITLI